MKENKTVFTKEDANKALDNINMWIGNCDTKTSIILGFYAAIVTICLSTDFLDIQSNIFAYFFKDLTVIKVIYIIVHLGAILVFVFGIIELLRVIVPRIILKANSKENFKSLLFYGSIAEITPTYEKYCEEVAKIKNEQEILDDLLFQVHSAAIICNKKFHYQKIGLFLTTISMIIFFITTIIGIFVV